MSMDDPGWMPQACTLPTAQRPLRLAQFDDLFATGVRGQRRLSPTRLRWSLDPAAEPTARDLTGRESSCYSFFTFTLTAVDGLWLDVQVPAAYIGVLDALAARVTGTATWAGCVAVRSPQRPA